MLKRATAILVLLSATSPSLATTGPGCLYVVNVAADDTLNMRASASASSAIVDRLVPNRHGILSLKGKCIPESRPWGQRWCPVRHIHNDRDTHGWVKARYVRDSDCP